MNPSINSWYFHKEHMLFTSHNAIKVCTYKKLTKCAGNVTEN